MYRDFGVNPHKATRRKGDLAWKGFSACFRSLASGVIALGLAGASIPDARARTCRFYVGLNVPVVHRRHGIDHDRGPGFEHSAPDERQRYKAKSTSEYARVLADGGLRVRRRPASASCSSRGRRSDLFRRPWSARWTLDRQGSVASRMSDISTGSNCHLSANRRRVDQTWTTTPTRCSVAARAGQQFAQNLPVPEISTTDTVFARAGVGYRSRQRHPPGELPLQSASDLEFEAKSGTHGYHPLNSGLQGTLPRSRHPLF